jgi:lysophospholipase L1-like esterase
MNNALFKKTENWPFILSRVLLIDSLILLVIFSCIETSLRTFFPEVKKLVFTENITGGNPVEFNSYGLRDIEFPVNKPKYEKRILVIGNSTTFGSGVALENTYPKQLQKLLGEPYFVINAGGQGASLSDAIDFIEKQGLKFSPEVIILGFSPSMISKNNTNQQKQRSNGTIKDFSYSLMMGAHKTLGSSYAYSLLDYLIRKNMYLFGIIEDNLARPNTTTYAYAFDVPGVEISEIENRYEEFFNHLKHLKETADKNNIALQIVSIPPQFDLSPNPENNPRRFPLKKIRINPIDEIKKNSQNLNIQHLDLRNILKNKKRIYTKGDYTHLNEKGLKIIAEEIKEKL